MSRRADQQGGNPLFSVLREQLGKPKTWKNSTVFEDRVKLQLRQNREPKEEFLGEAIAEAFYQNPLN